MPDLLINASTAAEVTVRAREYREEILELDPTLTFDGEAIDATTVETEGDLSVEVSTLTNGGDPVLSANPSKDVSEVTNETPELWTHQGGGVFKVDEGVTSGDASALLSGPCGRQRARLDIGRAINRTEAKRVVNGVAGSLIKSINDELIALIAAGGSKELLSTKNHSTANYAWNTECWAASMDWSCVAMKNSHSGNFTRAGTLITQQHIRLARHYPLPVGATVWFLDNEGTVHTRTVAGRSFDDCDRAIHVLNSPLPETCVPALVHVNWSGFLYDHQGEGAYIGSDESYRGFLGIGMTQYRQVTPINFSNPWPGTPYPTAVTIAGGATYAAREWVARWRLPFNGRPPGTGGTLPHPWTDSIEDINPAWSPKIFDDNAPGNIEWAGDIKVGDSGGPVTVLRNGKNVLWSTYWNGGSGGFDMLWNDVLADMIVAADTNAVALGKLGSPTGLTFAVDDPTGEGFTAY